MFLQFIYTSALFILAILALPKFLYHYFIQKKYRSNFLQRLGIGYPKIIKTAKRLVWIHAVSVGETKAIAKLAKQLKSAEPDTQFVISSITETGHAEALKSLAWADYHVFLPFDLSFVVAPILRSASPDLVILTETDLWYNFLKAAKARNAKIAVVNAKLSEKSFLRLIKLTFFARALYGPVDLFLTQNATYRERLLKLGVEEAKVYETGNLKFDEDYPMMADADLVALRARFGITPEDRLVILGSSHDPEEHLVLDQLKSLFSEIENLKLLIVPRHPERFNQVEECIKQSGLSYFRYSQAVPHPQGKVVLVDTMGILRQCYQMAHVAIVGGSFTAKVGGHNILEPSAYGVPVLFGPYMFSQPDMLPLVLNHQAGFQLEPSQLKEFVKDLLLDRYHNRVIGENGKEMMLQVRGSTAKSLALLRANF